MLGADYSSDFRVVRPLGLPSASTVAVNHTVQRAAPILQCAGPDTRGFCCRGIEQAAIGGQVDRAPSPVLP